MKRDFIKRSWRFGAWAGFVCAELFTIGLALFCVLMFGALTGPDSGFLSRLIMGFQLGGAIFLSGQVIGALPATVVGALSSIGASFIVTRFPHTIMRVGGVLWGFVYALATLVLVSGVLVCLLFVSGGYKSLFDIRFLFEDDFIPFWTVIILYLCSGAWTGSKLEELTRLYCKDKEITSYSG